MSRETFHFRDAEPREAGAIALVLARANAQRDGAPLPSTVEGEQVLDMQKRMNEANAWTYIAVGETGIAGFALAYPHTDKNTPAAEPHTEYLSLLMVEPDKWGLGIARELLKQVAEQARSVGRSRLTLWTGAENNARARSLYERNGFTVTGEDREHPSGRQVEYELIL